MSFRSIQIRLFISCWLVFVLHWATDFVREHYLVLTIVEDGSFRLDKYFGLHDDIFVTPDRGAHHGANPGASMIAAIPYFILSPVVNSVVDNHYLVTRQPDQEITAVYRDRRPARVEFYKQVRERGLDIKFGLVGLVTMAFCMAPLSSLSAVVMFRTLTHLGLSNKLSLGMAFLYALGTPVFLRTGYLNQNLMVGIFGFLAFILLWQPGGKGRFKSWQRYTSSGFLGGLTLLCDYSGALVLIMLAGYGLVRQGESVPLIRAMKDMLWYIGGALGPVVLLGFYQWCSFGDPFYPGQHYMPPVEWIDIGYQGVGWPSGELLWMLLFDLRFGLFALSPILLLAFFALVLTYFGRNLVPLRETVFILAFFFAFSIFFSSVQYTRLQWITGIRYMVPVIPFLFLLTGAVLVWMPRIIVYGLAVLALMQSWSMSMVRSQEGVVASIEKVLLEGFQLPWLNTLSKMAPQYAPFLADGASPLPLFILWGVLLYGVWGLKAPWRTLGQKDVLERT